MSLDDFFAATDHAIGSNANELGESITYTPTGGSASTLTGVVDDQPDDYEDLDRRRRLLRAVIITISTQQLTDAGITPSRGDSAQVTTGQLQGTYIVQGLESRDAGSWALRAIDPNTIDHTPQDLRDV